MTNNKGKNMKKVLVELNERELKVLKRVLNENEVIEVEYIDRDNYKDYIGKTVKVLGNGNVDLSELGLTKIPINFTEVGGYFYCAYNELTSLEGCPKEVGGDFYCYENKLTTLKGAPRKVGRDFHCWNNQLSSLEGSPEKVGNNFDCSWNKLTTLKGAPKEVGRNFYCHDNPLESIKGKPEYIGGEFEY